MMVEINYNSYMPRYFQKSDLFDENDLTRHANCEYDSLVPS